MAQLFLFLVSIVIVGWLWFFIVRPILESYEFIAPMEDSSEITSSDYQYTASQTFIDASQVPQIAQPFVSSSIASLTHLPIEERGHVVIAGRQGDGKTQTSITLLLADIAREAQVYWLNPHYTLFHPKDQRTDLTPVANRFVQVADYVGIVAALRAAYQLVHDERMPLYRAGKDVGHPIVLYLDEWPAIVDSAPDAPGLVKQLLRESRKCNVWLVLATQDAQVETLGLKGGVRAAFNTRLVGNVDSATWGALVGKDDRQQPLTWGNWWMARSTESGIYTWKPYTSADVTALAQRPNWTPFTPLVSSVSPAVTDVDRLLSQALGIPQGEQKTSEVDISAGLKSPETFQAIETNFSASESENDISGADFTPEEIAQIAARILSGETKSKAIQAMPRYSGPKYKTYSAYYDRLRVAIENV